MAKETRLVCDSDGSVDGVVTVRITVGDVTYEIDLCPKCRARYLDPLLKKARSGAPAVRTVAAMRAWALANGHKVPSRGGIPRAVQDAYDAAHGG